jgi:hypothetical protein
MTEFIYAIITSIVSSLIWYFIQLKIENGEKKAHLNRLEKEEIATKSSKKVVIPGENELVTDLYSKFRKEFKEYESVYLKDNELIIQSSLYTRLTRIMYFLVLISFTCFALPLIPMVLLSDSIIVKILGWLGLITMFVFLIFIILKLLLLKIRIDLENKVVIQRNFDWAGGKKSMYELKNYSKIKFDTEDVFPVSIELGSKFINLEVCAFPMFWKYW